MTTNTTSPTPVLDGLLSQKSVLENKINNHTYAISSLQNTIDAWIKSKNDWWASYLEDANNVLRQGRAAERYVNYQAAKEKEEHYTTLQNQEIAKRNQSVETLAQVNEAITGYYEAQQTAIANGVPEGGSIEVAEQYAASIQADTQEKISELEAQEKADAAKAKNTRNILIAIGLLLAAFLIWKFIIKKKK
jgi:hypothetical protein